SGGRDYMIHASRREKPGQAEGHTKDADVIYILQGSAKINTGGVVVDGASSGQDEVREAGILNGGTRGNGKVEVSMGAKGDPHQFLEVTNPLLYYVVKVR